MSFKGFNKSDFDTFTINGLDKRMEAIRNRIQPKFREIGAALSADLTVLTGNEMYVHIAKHLRRSVNPPKDTWLALSHNKRGYKQHPHFQVGLFDDHVFIWLAYIYELPNKKEMAQSFLNHFQTVKKTIPGDFVISLDHMKKDATLMKELEEEDLKAALKRFRDVKKVEFLVGRHIPADNPLLQNGAAFLNVTRETFETLLPLYKLSFA